MPTSITVVYPKNRYCAYKKGSRYFLTLTDTEEITKGEYKYILGDDHDRHDDPESDYKYRLKYFFFFEKEYTPERCYTVSRMRDIFLHKKNESDSNSLTGLCESVTDILDEYNAESAYMSFANADDRIIGFYGLPDPENKEDSIDKINRKIRAENAAVDLWDRGDMIIPYPGKDERIIGFLTKKITGQGTEEYVKDNRVSYLSHYGDLSVLFYKYNMAVVQDRDRVSRSLKACKYMSFRYMDHMLKGRHIIYSKVVSGDDITIMFFKVKGRPGTGYIEFESHDPISRYLTIINIKLAVMTGGRLPVIPGSYLLIRVLLIAFAQNVVLAIILTFADAVKSRKRRAAIVQ